MSEKKSIIEKIELFVESTVFGTRWLLAPFYIGLIFGIVLLFIKFVQELLHLSADVFMLTEGDVVVGILALIDVTLVSSLLLMIIFSGYEIFVSKIETANHKDRPEWMGKVDFSGLKLKMIGAIVAISAIDLLRVFVRIPENMTESEESVLLWKVIIHLSFVFSGVLFAVMDKVAGETKKH